MPKTVYIAKETAKGLYVSTGRFGPALSELPKLWESKKDLEEVLEQNTNTNSQMSKAYTENIRKAEVALKKKEKLLKTTEESLAVLAKSGAKSWSPESYKMMEMEVKRKKEVVKEAKQLLAESRADLTRVQNKLKKTYEIFEIELP